MKVAMIVVDGVLRKVMGGSPIEAGRRLYVSLANTGRIVLVSDLMSEDQEELSDWLTFNGFVQHDFVAWSPVVDAATRLRREGYDLDLVALADPAEAARLIASGLNTMLVTHAQYAHPRWRPDAERGVQPWDDITKQVADAARLKAADKRLKGE